jgi:hypothetical protein
MYQISRSIYRELAGDIVEDRPWDDGPTNHERVLWACEAAVFRLTTDRHYFARPARTLFNDIRVYFPLCAQQRVYQVVDRYHAVPAPAAAGQRLLPVPPAPRRDRGTRPRGVSASAARCKCACHRSDR